MASANALTGAELMVSSPPRAMSLRASMARYCERLSPRLDARESMASSNEPAIEILIAVWPMLRGFTVILLDIISLIFQPSNKFCDFLLTEYFIR